MDLLIVEGNDDIALVGSGLLAANEQMQQGAIAVPDAMDRQPLWHSPPPEPISPQLCNCCLKRLSRPTATHLNETLSYTEPNM